MKVMTSVGIALGLLSFALSGAGAEKKETPATAAGAKSGAAAAIFLQMADFKWEKMHPELGADSPEIYILHTDPTTGAMDLMIRSPSGIHVRKHWHSANETHTMISGSATFACDGKKMELGPGAFNYMPSKMIHEAWLTAGTVVFITVDAAWDLNWVEGPPTAADLMK